MTTTLGPSELRAAARVLSSPSLIRLITEIDDNGPIPPRALTATLSGLTPDRTHRAAHTARTLRLTQIVPGEGLGLTTAGSGLADFYDATARWARYHAYPQAACDFTSRIQHTLDLLIHVLTAETANGPHHTPSTHMPNGESTDEDLSAHLTRWLVANPQITHPGTQHGLAA
ncbi:regulator [Streptomyces sp. MAR4 CNY-716]